MLTAWRSSKGQILLPGGREPSTARLAGQLGPRPPAPEGWKQDRPRDGSQSQPKTQSRQVCGDQAGLRSNEKCDSGLGPAMVTWVRRSLVITGQVHGDKAGPRSHHKVRPQVRTRIRPDNGNQHQTQPRDHQTSP